MKIEVYSAHGGARYWQTLMRFWREHGNEVVEINAFDDKNYRRKRGRLSRVWLRIQTYILFPLRVWIRVALAPYQLDTVRLVVTSPFFLPWLVVSHPFRSKRVPVVNLINDIYPDALVLASMLKDGSIMSRVMSRMTSDSVRRSTATVYLGSMLKAHSDARYGQAPHARIIAVGADIEFLRKEPPNDLVVGERVSVLYSGTMGYMHDINTLASVFKCKVPQNVEFVFHSSGVGYSMLQERAPCPVGVTYAGPLSDSDWQASMVRHPIALVTLRSGAEHVSMPSKTYSALAAGQAILAICEADSDLARLVKDCDCGWVVSPGSVDALLGVVDRFASDIKEVNRKRRNAYRAAQDHYSMEVIAAQYVGLFEEVIAKETPICYS